MSNYHFSSQCDMIHTIAKTDVRNYFIRVVYRRKANVEKSAVMFMRTFTCCIPITLVASVLMPVIPAKLHVRWLRSTTRITYWSLTLK